VVARSAWAVVAPSAWAVVARSAGAAAREAERGKGDGLGGGVRVGGRIRQLTQALDVILNDLLVELDGGSGLGGLE